MRKREEIKNPSSCLNKAAENELTFILLGRDKSAPHTIRAWAAHRIISGKNKWNDPEILEARALADQMEREFGLPLEHEMSNEVQ